VLPLSDFDDRLRRTIANAIYRDPALSRYAGMGRAPIHIIVDNGHVTLAGTVNSDMEKQIAGLRASQSLSFGTVDNRLQVEHPSSKKSGWMGNVISTDGGRCNFPAAFFLLEDYVSPARKGAGSCACIALGATVLLA